MNIIAQQLNSKPSTQAMLQSFLNDMKQYFKKAVLLSQDRTYTRIHKIAENTQKYIPHFYCFPNIAIKLINNLKIKVEDKLQNNNDNSNQPNLNSNTDHISNQDIQALDKLQFKLSKDKQGSIGVYNMGRQINQQFMRKIVLDTIQDTKDQIQQSESSIPNHISSLFNNQQLILFFDAHLSNKSILQKIANEKKLNVKHIKNSEADTKNNQIHLNQVPSQMRNVSKVVISAEAILKNGSIIANSGSLTIALAAKKYNIPVIVIGRGFCLTQKTLIDQYPLLSENPMKFFKKMQNSTLKVFIGKRFDLIDSRLVSQIVTEIAVTNPANIQMSFNTYYDYN